MSKPRILVTGATGKTGGAVVNELLARDFPVRAIVHSRDARSEELDRKGAETVVADMFDPDQLLDARQGAAPIRDRSPTPIKDGVMNALEHRVPPPLVCLFFAAVMLVVSRLTPAIQIEDIVRLAITGFFAVSSLVFGAPAFMAFGRAKTTINPRNIEAASALVTSGVYKYTRNPMYVGLTALLWSLTAYLAAPWTALGPVAFLLFITRFQIIPEERVMLAKFGRAYDEYRKHVRRWL
jgi:protein-S-isoprenylcysteine O-methyltransferase Ste14